MTDTKTARPVAPGDTITFYEPGLVLDVGEPGAAIPHPVSTERGQSVCLTANMIQNSRDRLGATFLDLVDDEPEQVRRWGKLMFARGGWPEGEPILRRGSVEALLAREHRRMAALRSLVGAELKQALNEIDAELGLPSTVDSLGEFVR